jgi:hypothetical protein
LIESIIILYPRTYDEDVLTDRPVRPIPRPELGLPGWWAARETKVAVELVRDVFPMAQGIRHSILVDLLALEDGLGDSIIADQVDTPVFASTGE